MGSLLLFVALSNGGSVVYDHGYNTGGLNSKWVQVVEQMQVVGTYTTFKKEAALILEYGNGHEIMTLDTFRKQGWYAMRLAKKKKNLPVFDDSDLSVPFKYER